MTSEQLDYNLLFRWFVGLNMDDPIWLPGGIGYAVLPMASDPPWEL